MKFRQQRFAFVDIETTGPNSKKDRVIDVSIKILQDNKIVDEFNSLVNPRRGISRFIQNFTGITPDMVQDQPEFSEIALKVKELLSDCVFVAHNVRFDFNFLKAELARVNIDFNTPKLCTVKLSRFLFPEFSKHNLDEIISRYSLKIKNRHRAESDCEALVQFWSYISKNLSLDDFNRAIENQLGFARLPKGLNRELVENLPEQTGIYMFYSHNSNLPIYIGKSRNIKERVMQHFTGKISSKKDLKLNELTQGIEYIQTPGEFSALILESKLIKLHKPLLNKRLREHKIMYAAKLHKNEEGILIPKLVEVNSLDDVIGSWSIFKSKKDFDKFLFRICKDYHLCQSRLGLEKTKSACFNYQVDKCNGVCVQKESVESYNQRLESAFYKHKIKDWNFGGRVLLKEDNVYHLIDKWCYLTKIESESELEDSLSTNYEYNFNYDEYLILKKFLNGNYQYRVVSNDNSLDL